MNHKRGDKTTTDPKTQDESLWIVSYSQHLQYLDSIASSPFRLRGSVRGASLGERLAAVSISGLPFRVAFLSYYVRSSPFSKGPGPEQVCQFLRTESNAERKPGYARSPTTAHFGEKTLPKRCKHAGGAGTDVPKPGRQHDEAARGSAEGTQRGKEARIRLKPHDCHAFGEKTLPGRCKHAGGAGPDVPKAGRRGEGAVGQHDEAARGSAEGKQRGKKSPDTPGAPRPPHFWREGAAGGCKTQAGQARMSLKPAVEGI